MKHLTILFVLALFFVVSAANAAPPAPVGMTDRILVTPVLYGQIVTPPIAPGGWFEVTWQCVTAGKRTSWDNPEVAGDVYAVFINWADYCEARSNHYTTGGTLDYQSELATIRPVQKLNRHDFTLAPR